MASSKVKCKYYMIVVPVISLLIAMVKNFRYEVNYFNVDREYLYEFLNNPFHNPPKWKVIMVIVFNSICDSTIFIVFFCRTFGNRCGFGCAIEEND